MSAFEQIKQFPGSHLFLSRADIFVRLQPYFFHETGIEQTFVAALWPGTAGYFITDSRVVRDALRVVGEILFRHRLYDR